jgi:putative endonuclease
MLRPLRGKIPRPGAAIAMPFLYILRCRDGSLYTGIAKDLERRLGQHRAGRASRYTRSRLPVELAFSCEIATWGEALREELRIKGLPRRDKERLLTPLPLETAP